MAGPERCPGGKFWRAAPAILVGLFAALFLFMNRIGPWFWAWMAANGVTALLFLLLAHW